MDYWIKAARDEKDKRTYEYVNIKWQKYNEATKIHLKASYLRRMTSEINGYLKDCPNGKKVTEAKERKEFTRKKIKEYEPLL